MNTTNSGQSVGVDHTKRQTACDSWLHLTEVGSLSYARCAVLGFTQALWWPKSAEKPSAWGVGRREGRGSGQG